MKRLIIISIVLLNIFFTKAQKYTPFNFKDGIWTNLTTFTSSIPPDNITSIYFAEGDTIIKTKQFYKLYERNYHYFINKIIDSSYSYVGAINNNINNKQVRFCYKNDTAINVIYDFNIKIGDTLEKPSNCYPPIVIKKIDSVNFCELYHKSYYYYIKSSPHLSEYLIEGIGGSTGFLNSLCPFFEHLDVILLNYCEKNNLECYPCSSFLTSIKTINPQKEFSIIFNNETKIITIKNTIPIKEIILISVTSENVHVWYNCRNNSSFALNSLSNGIYIVRCYFTNGDVENKKIAVF